MAYTPKLSKKSSCTLRRMAWAWGVPMTDALEIAFDHILTIVDGEKVCERCRDKSRCNECVFKP